MIGEIHVEKRKYMFMDSFERETKKEGEKSKTKMKEEKRKNGHTISFLTHNFQGNAPL